MNALTMRCVSFQFSSSLIATVIIVIEFKYDKNSFQFSSSLIATEPSDFSDVTLFCFQFSSSLIATWARQISYDIFIRFQFSSSLIATC